MAYTITLPVGRSYDMTVDVQYALPSGNWAFTKVGAGTIQYSNDGTNWSNATSPVAATYVRSNGGGASIRIDHY